MLKTKLRLASGLVALALAAGPAAAQGLPGLQPPAPPAGGAVQVQILNNPTKGFQIGYPAGWQVIAGSDAVDYGFLSPDQQSFCVVISAAMQGLPPDEQLKQFLSVPQGEKFWNDEFFNQVKNVKYVHVGAEAQPAGGWPLQTVVATGDIDPDGAVVNYTFAGILTAKSGSYFRTMCYTPTTAFDGVKAQFFAVFESFKITK